MRNFEKNTRTNKASFGEEVIKKGSKRNKTVRGGGLKGVFRNENVGKSYLGDVWEVQGAIV